MTFAAEDGGEIFSRDAQGRVLVLRERRELLLEQYDRSGMSGVKFADYVAIRYSTLAYWLQSGRRKREREKSLLMEGGLKHSFRTVHGLASRKERYGFTLQEAPTVRSAVRPRWQWPRSCLDGWVQSDDQLQWKPEDILDG